LNTSNNDNFYCGSQFQAFFKNSNRSLVLKADAPRFTILAVSDLYLTITHKQREQLLGKGLFEVYPGSQGDPSEHNSVHSSFIRAIESKTIDVLPVFKYEIYVAETDSYATEYWTNANEPLLNEEGNVAYLINTTTNITNEVRTEKALAQGLLERKSNQRLAKQLQLAVEAAKIGYWHIEPDTKALEYSETLAKIFGYEGDEPMTYEQAIAQVTEEFRPMVLKEIEQAIASGGDYKILYSQGKFNSGEIIWLRSMGKITQDEEGNHSIFTGVVLDVTKQVTAAKELEEANTRLSFAMEAGGLGATEVEFATGEMKASAQFKKNYGRKPDESFTYADLFESIPPDYRDDIKRKVKEAIATDTIYTAEYPTTWPDGSKHWISAFGKARYDEQGNPTRIVGLTADITERVMSRQAIEESEERFRTMAEGSNILIAVGDESSKATYFSKAWGELTGRTMEDLLAYGWVDLVHPDDRKPYVNTYLTAFNNKKPFTGEFRVLNKEGNYRWLLANGTPIFRPDGSFAGYISSCVDITGRKQDEQRKSDFISMVSHELKTPITSLNGYLQVLKGRAEKADDTLAANFLTKSVKQVRRMTDMINGFLNMSRLDSGKIHIDKQLFDMADLVKEAEEESIASITTHRVVFAPVEATPVIADRDKIGQVITNLINNAVKYSPQGSTINVACVTANDMAMVSVQDEGIGIASDDIDKLFERYYRVDSQATKSVAGFGIGLYFCREIIERHEGTIAVKSEIGKGSTFYFTLPVNLA
jgi:PAS domain S-box-containing protein